MAPEQVTFLTARRVAYLATVDDAGRPHVVPICFAYCRGAIYTPVDEKPKRGDPRSLRRIQNILAHPQVCLLVEVYEDDWSQLAWLQVRGTAALTADTAERAEALAALRDRYAQYRAMHLEVAPLIRISPEQVVEWAAARRPER